MHILLKYKKYFFVIIILGFVVYFPIFFNGFVWDDYPGVLENIQVHQINIPLLFGPSFINSGSFYRPLTAVYFSLVYAISGNHAFLYHLIQLVLHIIITILLFIFFVSFFSDGIAFFLSLIFLIHPIDVESVAYIGSTLSQLFFLPGLLALLLATRKELGRRTLLWIFVLLITATFTKETGFLFLLLILLYRYLFNLGNLKKILIFGICIFALYMVLRFYLGGAVLHQVPYIPIDALSLPQRILNIPAIIAYYINTVVFPLTLTIWQTWVVTKLTFHSFIFPLIICVLFLIGVISVFYILLKEQKSYLQKTQKKLHKTGLQEIKRISVQAYLFFIFWFVIGMGVIMQIVPLEMTVADRWFYFQFAGLLGIIGIVLQLYYPKLKKHQKIYIVAAICIITVLSIRSFIRTFDWKNQLIIYTDAKHANDNYILDNVYSIELFKAGKVNEAIMFDEKSIATFADITNVGTLGDFYRESNQCDMAIPIYQKALSYPREPLTKVTSGLLNHDTIQLYAVFSNLSKCYIQSGQAQEAINLLNSQSLKDFPGDANLRVILAIAYFSEGNHQMAVQTITKAYSLDKSASIKSVYNNIINNGK